MKKKTNVCYDKLSEYKAYAKWLSYKYNYYGSGADEEDVFQIAMISAWKILEREPFSEKKFVFRIMRLRVLDFIRIRDGEKQKRFDRSFVALDFDVRGEDNTLRDVLIKDELKRVVKAVSNLRLSERRLISQHLEGIPHSDIGKSNSVDAMLSRARRKIEIEIGK